MEAEAGAMQSEAQGRPEPPEAGRGRKEPPEGAQHWTPGSDFCFRDCERKFPPISEW